MKDCKTEPHIAELIPDENWKKKHKHKLIKEQDVLYIYQHLERCPIEGKEIIPTRLLESEFLGHSGVLFAGNPAAARYQSHHHHKYYKELRGKELQSNTSTQVSYSFFLSGKFQTIPTCLLYPCWSIILLNWKWTCCEGLRWLHCPRANCLDTRCIKVSPEDRRVGVTLMCNLGAVWWELLCSFIE